LGGLVDLYANGVPKNQILTTNLWRPGLARLVATATLAQGRTCWNSVTQLCAGPGADVSEVAEAIGIDPTISSNSVTQLGAWTVADVSEVSKAIGMDPRIGSKFLGASVGFARLLVDTHRSGAPRSRSRRRTSRECSPSSW